MWTSRSQQLDKGRTQRISIESDTGPLAFAEVLRLWQDDAAFCAYFNDLLASSSYAAFRWETPAVTAATADRPFEFVLVDSPGLASTPDAKAFAAQFRSAGRDGVVSFHNLGKDAILVVPCPLGPMSVYGHLAAFVRGAPDEQRHALWRLVGKAMEGRLGKKPVWLSTAGAGVAWLHVRLDDRPKYYHHVPYRDAV